jgi:AcrR family transcriptional regulator
MESREKILEAAARVYAETGFRGATTRRIAEEAGVNEITIFRHFGSKAALIAEALRSHTGFPSSAVHWLPETPADPERELTAWSDAHLTHLRHMRSLIRTTMGELEERPEVAPCAAEMPRSASADLRRYLDRLYDEGFVREDACQRGERNDYAHAAVAMLMGVLFADAMGRDMMPEMYPQPASRAPALYVRLFLCAIGVQDPVEPPKRTPADGRRGARSEHLPSTKHGQ